MKMIEGTSSFLVPRGTPGFTVMRCNETMGGRFMNNGEMVFEDCAVPRHHCLAENNALAMRAGHYSRPGRRIPAPATRGECRVPQATFINGEWARRFYQVGAALFVKWARPFCHREEATLTKRSRGWPRLTLLATGLLRPEGFGPRNDTEGVSEGSLICRTDRSFMHVSCGTVYQPARRRRAALAGIGSGNAVLYFTCFRAKLDLMLATPGIFAR